MMNRAELEKWRQELARDLAEDHAVLPAHSIRPWQRCSGLYGFIIAGYNEERRAEITAWFRQLVALRSAVRRPLTGMT
jgi:hypothetical protein